MTVENNSNTGSAVETQNFASLPSDNPSTAELQIKIRELEKEIARLHTQIKEQRYGLTWLDVPEAFETESENKIPILEEVKEKAIDTHSDDEMSPHIIIEGDNYHALTCLNFTHRGKIDVIYIDPPYNTGGDGFTYKDKRILKEFPDGSPVPTDHPLRHSYWLSFMSKRLELAKNLLSDKGVIFISIDDNEQANLKLLCDKVFGEENFIAMFSVIVKTEGRRYGGVAKTHEFTLVFAKKIENVDLNEIEVEGKNFHYSDYKGGFNIQELRNQNARAFNSKNRPNLRYPFYVDSHNPDDNGFCKVYLERQDGLTEVFPIIINGNESVWRWGRNEKASRLLDELVARKGSDGIFRIYQKMRKLTEMPKTVLMDKDYLSIKGTREIEDIIELGAFDFPKPINLIKMFLSIASNSSSNILDFFAGSGTTLHATMKLNAEDGGHRQCILVQQKEGDNNICENVTYERNRRVICGYTNAKGEEVEGLGGRLKYYRTAFVGKNASREATDADRVELALKAGYLLAMGENTLEEICHTDSYQFFADVLDDKKPQKITAIFFTENYIKMPEFVAEIERLRMDNTDVPTQFSVYIFCWGEPDIFEGEFDDLRNISLKAIPQPILDVYKSINQ